MLIWPYREGDWRLWLLWGRFLPVLRTKSRVQWHITQVEDLPKDLYHTTLDSFRGHPINAWVGVPVSDKSDATL